MIPDPQHVIASLDALDEMMEQQGWDQNPSLLMLQAPNPAMEGMFRTALGIPDDMRMPLVGRHLPQPAEFIDNPATGIVYITENYAWPAGPWQIHPILPPAVTDLIDANFAGLVMVGEAWATIFGDMPANLRRTLKHLTGRQEVRIAHVADTAGWIHMHVRFRSNNHTLSMHTTPDGSIYAGHHEGEALTALRLDGIVPAAMRILVASLCRRHLHIHEHDMPPVPRKEGTGVEAIKAANDKMFPPPWAR